MKDYYEILGVEEDASQEEIRERWLELSKLYHPDVLKSPEADERIKEINEAYQVLKDYATRLEYDLQRALQKSLLKKYTEREKKKFPWSKVFLPTSISVGAAWIVFLIFFKSSPIPDQAVKLPIRESVPSPEISPLAQKTEGAAKVVSSDLPHKAPPSAQSAEHFPQRPEPAAEPKLMAKIVPQEEGKLPEPGKKLGPPKAEARKQLESKPELAKVIIREEKKKPDKPQISEPLNSLQKAKDIFLEKPKTNEAEKIKPEKIKAVEKPKEIEKPLSVEVAKVAPLPIIPPPEPIERERPQKSIEKPQEILKAPPPELFKAESPQIAHVGEAKKVDKLEQLESPKAPEKNGRITREIRPEPAQGMAPEIAEIKEAKKPEKIETPEKTTSHREEEVKKFLDGYIAKYKQKDINGFLSFFSTRAIQNQKYNFADLKKIYANFFDQSLELSYQLKDVQTSEHPQGWEVKAKYELSQVTKKDGAKKSWRGQIRWLLVRENGELKILSLDYQHQK